MKNLRLTALTLAALALSSCTTTSLDAMDEMFSNLSKKRESPEQSTGENPEQSAKIQKPTTSEPVVVQQTERATVEDNLLPSAPAYQSTSTIPGRSGLRMGRYAPPEEAASTRENAAPAPNAAELHGLRSPSLPKSLPLDINGQTKKD